MTARPRLLVALAALVVVLAIVAFLGGRSQPSRSPFTFEVDLRVSAGSYAQLFWAGDWAFTEERSTRVPLQPTADGFQRLRILFPSPGIRWLRFDPTDASGEVLIRNMRVLDSNRQVLRAFDSQNLKPAHQILSVTQEGEVTRLVTAA